ncbi:MAG: phytanoyl-CoA dioxygenase family protein [Alphaproteobacteria bacterium]
MADKDFAALGLALRNDGFCVARGLLPADLIAALRAHAARIVPTIDDAHRARNRSQGSLVQLAEHPEFAEVIGAPALLAAFAGFGFADTRYSGGYLISKPPHSPALFWHQDWWGWDDPISYTAAIAQVFVMIYLTDTSPANGCLRVIPGSHRRRHPLHAALQAHDERLSRVEDPGDPLYQPRDDAVPVPVAAGDVVFGDARLLHATHPNDSDAERSLLTLWFHPNHGTLPAAMRMTIRQVYERRTGDTDPAGPEPMTIDDWPEAARRRIAPVQLPPISGVAPHPWNRIPHWLGAEGMQPAGG